MNVALRKLAEHPLVVRFLALSGLLSTLSILATILAFTLIAQAIAEGLHVQALPDMQTLGLIVAALLLRAVCSAGREWTGTHLATKRIHSLRTEFVQQTLTLGPVLLSGHKLSGLALLNADLDTRLTPFFARFLPSAVHAGISVPLIVGYLLWVDPLTAGLLALTGPLTILFLYLVGLATHAATEQQWMAHTRLGARMLTLTRHLPTLQAFGQVGPYREVLGQTSKQHSKSTLKVLRVAFLSGFVMEFAGTLSTALVAVWIGVRLFEGTAELAPTLAALMLVAEFFGPLRQVGADRHAAMDAEPVAARLLELSETPTAPFGRFNLSDQGIELKLDNVRAAIPTTTSRLSAQLSQGTHVALRGPSGSGKSSLLHAIRKHIPHEGCIWVNGYKLDELNTPAWQEGVVFVPQHPRLVAGSVSDNLRLAHPKATLAELQTAAQAVGLWPIINALPQGFDTPLGEGGVMLSGGETARLALARALLSGAELILLDEITAHLDQHTEQAILATIREAFHKRSVILATHRPVPDGFVEWKLTAEEPAI